MQEDEIAKQLAAKVDPVPPPATDAPETPVEPEKKDENFHNNLPLENTFEKQQLMDYLMIPQISRHTQEIQQWTQEVLEWAKDESHSSEFADIVRVIDDQERIMGNKLKPDRLLRLRTFIKIHNQRKQLAARERALYG